MMGGTKQIFFILQLGLIRKSGKRFSLTEVDHFDVLWVKSFSPPALFQDVESEALKL